MLQGISYHALTWQTLWRTKLPFEKGDRANGTARPYVRAAIPFFDQILLQNGHFCPVSAVRCYYRLVQVRPPTVNVCPFGLSVNVLFSKTVPIATLGLEL